MLAAHGVTCLRLMMEYCQGEHRYLERPVGFFQPNMVRLWDDVFALCERHGLRILLTPYDTFWMWIRWKHHPYNVKAGGVCKKRSQWLLCSQMRQAIKNRLAFATQRWGGSGALFAWDIWNEIHPAHGGNSADGFYDFIEDISSFLRKTETELHGRAHPQTVSVFGPVLNQDERIADCSFCHPSLDFASIHFYEKGTIDNPKNTVDAALSAGCLTRNALQKLNTSKPFFDSEHGPIHLFKDRRITLPEPFDDEYFRHIQWAHFASGGAGGGMRWPNRHPHTLTRGMRKAQAALSRFLPLINWQQFKRVNLNREIKCSDPDMEVFGCADQQQAVIWLLRKNNLLKNGMVNKNAEARAVQIRVSLLQPGNYKMVTFNTTSGSIEKVFRFSHIHPGPLLLPVPALVTDVAIAIQNDNVIAAS